MGKKWGSKRANKCNRSVDLHRLQKLKTDEWFSEQNQGFILMLSSACKKEKKDKNNKNLKILISDDVLHGKTWDSDWSINLNCPWMQPAIQLWARILMLFEGLNDAANTNVVFNLGELMQTASGKDTTTACNPKQRAEKMLMPL
eukprot:2155583-Rhodomonas_salina.1